MCEIKFSRDRPSASYDAVVMRAETPDGMLLFCKISYSLLRRFVAIPNATTADLYSTFIQHREAFEAVSRRMIDGMWGKRADFERCPVTGHNQVVLTPEAFDRLRGGS
jgi:hypothetical protein